MNQQELQEQVKLQEQIAQLENVVKQYLTKEALQRYGNLKVAHPQKAMEIISRIMMIVVICSCRQLGIR